MNKAFLEIIYLAICFIAIIVASVMIYNGNYGTSVFNILGFTLLAIIIFIILKNLKKI